MIGNDSGLYAAFKARDSRFDGRFFVGVSSTGIYCRPVCRARKPKATNCTFFATAAEAEQAGYRSCLLCRPEQAPGSSITDASSTLARRAAGLLEEHCGSGQNLNELASQLGCTDRHLRRVFMTEYNVTPLQYLQTCRLLLAKSLLTDTNLTVLNVAMASGYGSLRRFNDVFKKQYRLSPTGLRRQTRKSPPQEKSLTLHLGYRPPYLWDNILRFLSTRAIVGIEIVQKDAYWRTAHVITPERKHLYGWFKVSHASAKNALSVTMSESLLPVLPQVLGNIRHLFDLNGEPEAVYQSLSSMNDLSPHLCQRGTRLPGCFDAFEMAVRAVLGQQITVKAARTLTNRMVQTYGTPIKTGIGGLTHSFPTAQDLLELKNPLENHLGPLGITSARSHTIHQLAVAFVQKSIDFGPSMHPEKEMERLLAIKGIGTWTAHYIAMRAMAWTDAFLETDAGIKKALRSYSSKELLNLAEQWRPWRSYAVINLWNSLQ